MRWPSWCQEDESLVKKRACLERGECRGQWSRRRARCRDRKANWCCGHAEAGCLERTMASVAESGSVEGQRTE